MDPITALWALAALVAGAAVVAVVLRSREGRATSVRMPDQLDPALIGAARWGESATLLQFSTEFCSRCPGVRRTLEAIARERSGVAHIDVDLTHRADLANHFRVLQTPTTLVLDRDGVVRTRFGGAVTRAALEREVDRITGGHRVGV
ncbi:TlpA family protein disulfide reductase [Microbacterium sp. P01]|uniref:TlpA family protein disulfide reductase n=1 Tax=unclassified Microbacterium TaxID=2609290 RepID=UPI003673053C